MGKEELNKIRVVVGLSGGVDSSVAVLILKQAGFDVRGVYLKCYWTYEGCQSDQDRNCAARVASELDIPFEVWDFEKEYRQTVIEYFYDEYKKGRTPNPDVVCNREIKFGLFLRRALGLSWDSVTTQRLAQGVPPSSEDLGSSSTLAFEHNLVQRKLDLDHFSKNISHGPQSTNFIATGHYARIGIGASGEGLEAEGGKKEVVFPKFSQWEEVADSDGVRYVDIKEYLGYLGDLGGLGEDGLGTRGKLALFGGVDSKKDQSYFLYDIPKSTYEHILYPLGNLTKNRVREIARKENLPTADRPDSSGICFIGEVNIEKFLKERIPESRGDVIDKKGNVIGEHKGVQFYTVGQRHGFVIADSRVAQRLAQGVPPSSEDLGSSSTLAFAQPLKSARQPYYVIGKNVERNELMVGMGEECKTDRFLVKTDRNFQFSSTNFQLFVRIRNLGEMIPCQMKLGSDSVKDLLKESSLPPAGGTAPPQRALLPESSPGGNWEVKLNYPVFGIAPGQSAVFYRKVGNVDSGTFCDSLKEPSLPQLAGPAGSSSRPTASSASWRDCCRSSSLNTFGPSASATRQDTSSTAVWEVVGGGVIE